MLENKQIGIDIVKIERFRKKKIFDNQSFYEKIFTRSEIAYCRKFSDPYPHFAGKFALKESVKKSINRNISFLDIEISYKNSKPQITIFGKQKNRYNFLASVSHDGGIATAIVLSEKLP